MRFIDSEVQRAEGDPEWRMTEPAECANPSLADNSLNLDCQAERLRLARAV